MFYILAQNNKSSFSCAKSGQNIPFALRKGNKAFPSTGSVPEIARDMWFPVSDLRLKSATWHGSERPPLSPHRAELLKNRARDHGTVLFASK